MSPESEGFSCSGATQHILDYSSFQILLSVMSQPLFLKLTFSSTLDKVNRIEKRKPGFNMNRKKCQETTTYMDDSACSSSSLLYSVCIE